MKHRKLGAAATFAAALAVGVSLGHAGLALAAPSDEAVAKRDAYTKLYIVQMADAPVVAYAGGVAGYAATKPGKGQKIDPQDPKVAKYKDYLASKHDAAIRSVGGARKAYSYGYVYNGFAAELSEAQAAKLESMPGVLAVTRDAILKRETATTPKFLGLTDAGSVWEQLGGPTGSTTKSGAGEGIVIGIVDSGIWPEHPSFSDREDQSETGKLAYTQIPGWHGKCVPGEQFPASKCGQKLIAAQYYTEGWGGPAAIKAQFPYEFISARDADGHGSHTASTAGGNYGVTVTGPAAVLGRISGIAPRARIASYKVCWGQGDEGGCPNSDSVAAIDQAVADGVDVINFSISGTTTNFRDPVEIAFLFAADAGVFVAASAGNSGPTASTVAHPSPWITTVAAGTHDRDGAGSITLGNGVTYFGASLAESAVTAPMIAASAAGKTGADPTLLSLCYGSADGATPLDPAKVAGKIVVCDRGVTARVNKSLAVKEAGGVGMVLVNTSASSLNADFHAVPTVHLAHTDRPAVLAYAATAGATGTIAKGVVTTGQITAPTMASFSSRGPLRAGNGDLLKPDIVAPGQDILAAVSPVGYGGNTFDLLSGTSMSSPHVAGLAALLKHLRPEWSPMAIKSALMTTAYQTTKTGNAGATFGTPFDFGAGHVDINKAANPGLVFDSSYGDWLGFLCGTQLPVSFCTSAGVPVLDPSNLNVPSVAFGDLAGSQTVKRKLRNVSSSTTTYTSAIAGLAGSTVTVTPASFTLAPGQTQEVSITVTNVSAPLNTYRTGAIVWTGGGNTVRIPVVSRPVALAAPTAVSGTGGPLSYGVTFGYTGPFTTAARGMVPANVTPGTVTQDPDQTFVQNDPAGTVAIPVTIPAGTTYARFALFDADVAAGSDMDLYVYQGTALAGASTNGTSAEEVNFTFANPTASAIALTVYVHGWGLPSGSSPFKLHAWYLGATAAGNMTVTAPTTATLGATGTVSLSFSGLAAGTKYLGSVVYGGATGMPAPTIVRVDAP